jgi:F0F1-type ATP synthase membrane subunit b/b'
VKTWWTETGWPWLKGNWWVLLLLPLMALVAIGMFMMRFMTGPKTVVVDPLAGADERAKLEAETRAAQLEAERDRLAKELADLRTEHAGLRAQFEQRLEDRVQELRDDPEKLRQAMLDAGKPGRVW